jgi:hypothetical protein
MTEPTALAPGPMLLGNDTTLPRLWDWLHNNAMRWAHLYRSSPGHRNLAQLDQVDRDNLALLQDCPAARWTMLCRAAGVTELGAAALSWCSEATEAAVWEMWRAAKPGLEPSPEFLRPTRLLAPAIGNFSISHGTARAAAARSRMISGSGAISPCCPIRSPR